MTKSQFKTLHSLIMMFGIIMVSELFKDTMNYWIYWFLRVATLYYVIIILSERRALRGE